MSNVAIANGEITAEAALFAFWMRSFDDVGSPVVYKTGPSTLPSSSAQKLALQYNKGELRDTQRKHPTHQPISCPVQYARKEPRICRFQSRWWCCTFRMMYGSLRVTHVLRRPRPPLARRNRLLAPLLSLKLLSNPWLNPPVLALRLPRRPRRLHSLSLVYDQPLCIQFLTTNYHRH